MGSIGSCDAAPASYPGSCEDTLASYPGGPQWAPMELGQVPKDNRINSWRRFGEQDPFQPQPNLAMFCMPDSRQQHPDPSSRDDDACAEVIMLQDQEDDL